MARKQHEWLSSNRSAGEENAEHREEAQMDSETPAQPEVTKKRKRKDCKVIHKYNLCMVIKYGTSLCVCVCVCVCIYIYTKH